MSAVRGRWRVLRYDGSSTKILGVFPTQIAADERAESIIDDANVHVEFDPVIAYGDGKKSKYGPTYASEVREDWLA